MGSCPQPDFAPSASTGLGRHCTSHAATSIVASARTRDRR